MIVIWKGVKYIKGRVNKLQKGGLKLCKEYFTFLAVHARSARQQYPNIYTNKAAS